MASPKKRAKKSASKVQEPVIYPLTLDNSVEQDLENGNQAMDINGLEGVMDILVDISSRLQATERGMEDLSAEMVTTRTQSPTNSQQGGHAARGQEQSHGQLQPPSQEADLSDAV